MTADGRPVGVLVVGAGFIGAQRAAAVAATAGARLVGVCDVDAAAAEAVARRFGAAAGTDFEAALNGPGVDALIVATPHADHFRQASAALEAGKHVLVEKPLAVDADDARGLALRADELRLRLATGLNHRFYPPVADALALAAGGALGRVEGVRAEIGHTAGPGFLAGWHTDVARSGGGTLMDNGPHACDVIRLLLGEVTAATGYLRRSQDLSDGCEVEAVALFRGPDRGVAELRSSWRQPTGYLTLDVRGSAGWLRVETAPWRLVGVLNTGQRLGRGYLGERVAERLFRRRFGCERSHAREVAGFLASTRGRRVGGGATGWDGCRAAEMVAAVYRSDATGAEVRLPPSVVNLPSRARRRALREAPA
jgi:predicted dehydrogenase